MQGNFIMLQMDDLRQVVTEIVEEVCAKRGLNEKPSEEEGEWLTREEVCDNLYSKKDVTDIFSSAIEDCDNNKKCKEECHG